MKKEGLAALIIVLFLGAALAVSVLACQSGEGQRVPERAACRALSRALGSSSPCLTCECSCARSLAEGCHGLMSDIPSGYCIHRVCDITAPPPLPRASLYHMRIVRLHP